MLNKLLVLLFFYLIMAPSKIYCQISLGNEWVDSVFHSLSLDEKIGQLFMVRAFSNEDKVEQLRIKKLITEEKIGGICFFQGTPEKQLELTNQYQSLSSIPLMVAIDGEWGLGMRHPSSTISYPRQLMLGAIQDNNLIYEMGKDIADQCKRIGVNVNFAPVVDVNNNINNPVINDRSFGEDKINVAGKAYAYMQGLQENGILATAKHFPGHGDTEVDSHLDLPIINHTLERLQDIELFPFKSLINLGIGSIMVAHLHIPALDNRPNRATTLSKKSVTSLLREELGFSGVVFTDAMEMKGVTKHFESGQADAEAILAGNDIVLLPLDVVKAKKAIHQYIKDKKISIQQLNESVLRILNAKANYPANRKLRADNLSKELNLRRYVALRSQLVENAITLADNSENIVPIINSNQNFLSIAIGSKNKNPFQSRLDDYAEFKHITLPKVINQEDFQAAISSSKGRDLVIVSLHNLDSKAKTNYGLDNNTIDFINTLSQKQKVLLVVFGNPYSLRNFDAIKNVIVAYEDTEMSNDITAQSIFGANSILGKLPITASKKYYLNLGITTPSLGRLGFSIPERVGMSQDSLNLIAKTVDTIINSKASPGCQILIARHGKIVYRESFGTFTYNKNSHRVKNDDLYDLASITKVMASTLAVMKLSEEAKLDINLPIDTYLPQTLNTNKQDITLSEMMSHHAGLRPWIPFYESTVEKKKRKNLLIDHYYSDKLQDSFSIPVAENLFLRTDYRDTILNKIYDSDLRESNSYRYSDLGFYMTAFCVENKCLTSIDKFVESEFYTPLGLKRTLYKPLDRINKLEIAPSENDTYFRNKVLQGEVHDMGAAMLGGVSGHAGLFSTAYELGIISQMLLNKGSYGGKTYLTPATIDQFTHRFYRSTRRAIGFDMKELDTTKKENISPLASDLTYGHYGFTGTAVFIDPEKDLIYIFLSNRTYPTMKNNAMNKKNYRSKIQTLAYKAII